MADQVNVSDLEVFRQFRAAMLKFAQTAGLMLANGESEIARMHSWLEGEQSTFWQGQLRKRNEALVRARDALRAKKMFKDSAGKTPDTTMEEKALAQCIAAVEHAERKLKAVRSALPRLEKAAGEYRGGASGLTRATSGEIAKAVALLDRLSATLEAYLQLEGPAVKGVPSMAAQEPADVLGDPEGSMSRGGEAGEEPAAGPEARDAAPGTGTGEPAEAPADPARPGPEGSTLMALLENSGALSRAAKDLFARWNDVKSVWSDAQSKEFEKVYLIPLEQDVRSALGVIDQMAQVLQRIKSDCE